MMILGGVVREVAYLGAVTRYEVELDSGEKLVVVLQLVGLVTEQKQHSPLAVGGLVAGIGSGMSLAFVPFLALFAGWLPILWLMMRRKRRFKKFAKQLPDALELISRALRAGHSLASGFNLVADVLYGVLDPRIRYS